MYGFPLGLGTEPFFQHSPPFEFGCLTNVIALQLSSAAHRSEHSWALFTTIPRLYRSPPWRFVAGSRSPMYDEFLGCRGSRRCSGKTLFHHHGALPPASRAMTTATTMLLSAAGHGVVRRGAHRTTPLQASGNVAQWEFGSIIASSKAYILLLTRLEFELRQDAIEVMVGILHVRTSQKKAKLLDHVREAPLRSIRVRGRNRGASKPLTFHPR